MRGFAVAVANARAIPLRDGCVQCVVTSPPYFGLRDYGVDGQIGSEASLSEFLFTIVEVMREVRRVLRDDGTVWLNMGDSFASSASAGTKTFGNPEFNENRPSREATKTPARKLGGFRPKCKMLVPHRLAIALCDDGWIVRQDIVWSKPNPMPESTRDRPTTAHEFLFLLTKQPRYYYDAEAVREPLQTTPHAPGNRKLDNSRNDAPRMGEVWGSEGGRNKRSVWTIPSHPFPDAHFATFPPKLVEPCILAGTAQKVCPTCFTQWVREVDVVQHVAGRGNNNRARSAATSEDMRPHRSHALPTRTRKEVTTTGWSPGCECQDNDGSGSAIVFDPFTGSGTTGVVARQMGRAFFGTELKPEYAILAENRIATVGEGRTRTVLESGFVVEQQVLAL